MMSLASRRLTASATRCCWAPSCRFRSTRRRSASPLATMRARDSRSSSACLRSSSRVVCSAESSWALWKARPTCRASSVSTRSSSSEKVSAAAGRSTTISPSSSPAWLTGATRSWLVLAAVEQRGQPDRDPGVAGHAGPGHDRTFPVGDHDRPRPGVRHRDRPLQHVARSRCRPRRWSAPWSCAATRPAAAAARPWGWPGSAGCRRCAAPRREPPGPRRRSGWPRPRAGPWPGRYPIAATAAASIDSPSTSRSAESLGAVPEAEHDHQVDGRDDER